MSLTKHSKKFSAVILAAGEGVRMRSKTPKVLHRAAGLPLIEWVLDAVRSAGIQQVCLVLGKGKDHVEEFLCSKSLFRNVKIVHQKRQLGSAHALLQAEGFLKKSHLGSCIVLCGDTPLVHASTLQKLSEMHDRQKAAATVLSAQVDNPFGYGRIIRNPAGAVCGIVEERDGSVEERSIQEINSGIYCFNVPMILNALKKIKPNNKKKEYYLTDAIHIIKHADRKVCAYCTDNASEVAGINNRVQLAQVEKILRRSVIEDIMRAGVTVMDPDNTYVDQGVSIGKDTVIFPGTLLTGSTQVGRSCLIGPYTVLKDATVEDEVCITASHVYSSVIRRKTKIGPYAHIRPDCDIGPDVKIGNFVEVKKSRLRRGTKAGHLAYLGNADISEKVNIGAGAITCNYDGKHKYETVIGKEAFIGTNTSMVAPLTIGEKSFIAAGSTITDHVPSKKLAIARSRQVIKERKKQ